MKSAKAIRITLTAVLLLLLLAGYGVWLVLETPQYWETYVFISVLFLLFSIAIIRFIPYLIVYMITGSEPHLDRIGERTYRRCGMRELAKITLLILILRLLHVMLTYLIHIVLFGYTETFFKVQRLWLNFYHPQFSFPAYPILSNLFWFVSFNFNHARFLSSYLYTALAGAALYYWVLVDFDRPAARHAMLFFFLMPASCLLLGTLPDGMFLLFSILSLMLMRRRRFILSNLFAMLAVMTHIMGALLFVPCIIEFSEKLIGDAKSHREEKHGYLLQQIASALSFLLVPLGFAVVLAYSRYLFGDTTSIFHSLMDYYGYHPASPLTSAAGLMNRFLEAFHTTAGNDFWTEMGNTVPNLIYVLFGAVLLVFAPGRIRTSYIAYMLVTFFAVLSTGVLLEIPRLLSMCCPFVLTLTLTVKKRWLQRILYIVCFGGFLLYLTAVVGGYTIYGK